MIDTLIEQLIAATEAGKLTWVRDDEQTLVYYEHSLKMYVSMWVISVS